MDKTLSDLVREAIKADARPVTTLADECGIGRNTLSRFVNQTGEMGSDKLDRLVEILELEIDVKSSETDEPTNE